MSTPHAESCVWNGGCRVDRKGHEIHVTNRVWRQARHAPPVDNIRSHSAGGRADQTGRRGADCSVHGIAKEYNKHRYEQDPPVNTGKARYNADQKSDKEIGAGRSARFAGRTGPERRTQ